MDHFNYRSLEFSNVFEKTGQRAQNCRRKTDIIKSAHRKNTNLKSVWLYHQEASNDTF